MWRNIGKERKIQNANSMTRVGSGYGRENDSLAWRLREEPVPVDVRGFRDEDSQQMEPKPRITAVPGEETKVVGPSKNSSTRVKTVVDDLKGVLDKRPNKCIPYWELITHPTSLWHTIDNLVQLAYLMRERVIRCEKKEDGEYWVRMISDEERKGLPEELEEFTASIDIDIQQEKVKRYNITKPLLRYNIAPEDEQF